MKNLRLTTLTALSLLLFFSMSMYAQPRQGGIFCNIPDLTTEQQEQINSLKTTHLKTMLDLRNKTREKTAKLQILRTSDKVDMNEINNVIDEIGVLRTEKMKASEAHKQEVRKILTNSQRVIFDMNSNKRCSRANKMGMKKGRGQGFGNNGTCLGRGYGYGSIGVETE